MLAKIDRKIVISILFILILFRVCGDILLYFSAGLESDSIVIWKFITSIPIILGLFHLFVHIRSEFNKIYEQKEKTLSNEARFEFFFNTMTNYLGAALIVLIVIEYLRPDIISDYLLKKSLFQLVVNDLFAVLIITFGIIQIFAYFRTTSLNKTKYSKIYEISYIVLLCAIFALSISDNILPEIYVSAGSYLIYFLTFILIIYSSNFSNAIAINEKKTIFSIIAKSVLILLLGSKVFYSLYSSHGHLRSTMEYFQSYSSSVIVYSFFITILLYSKAIITALLSLPTNNLVRRKSSEFELLRNLNEQIVSTHDIQLLSNTITQKLNEFTKSTNITQISHSWIEIFEENNIHFYYSKVNIKDLPEPLRKDPRQLRQEYSDVVDFDSNKIVKENNVDKNAKLRDRFNVVKSYIIYPIKKRDDDKKIGNFVIISSEANVFSVEIEKLLTAISDSVSISIHYALLIQKIKEQEKYEREMELAREMQEKLLPTNLPTIENYSIKAYSKSAESVGGDYYEMVTLKNGNPCLLIGDVSGKGISASFYMAQFKGVIIASASESNSGEELLKKVNNLLHGNIDRKIYISLCSLEINDSNGNITICRAGHMPIILKQNGVVSSITPGGMAIGLTSSKGFDKCLSPVKIKLNEGDSCLLYTDGLNEGKDNTGKEYGIDNLKQCIQNNVFTTGDEMISVVLEDFQAFTNEVAPFDDVTIFAIKYK